MKCKSLHKAQGLADPNADGSFKLQMNNLCFIDA